MPPCAHQQPARSATASGRDEEQIVKKVASAHNELRALNSVRVLNPGIPVKTYWQRMALITMTDSDLGSFLSHMYQPLVILCSFPAVAFTALQYGAMLSWFSILATTESTYFSADPYNFNTTGIGLLNLAPFVGGVIATFYSGLLSDWSIQQLAKRNKGVYEPEMRLYLAILPAMITPAGLFLYGYSVASVCSSPFN